MTVFLFSMFAACGGSWTELTVDEAHGDFPMTCGHATAACDACHGGDGAPQALESACLACHEADRPASHDPVTTATCDACHTTCGWDSTSPHPAGFAAPEAHGVAFDLQDPVEGDCRDCHGSDLAGGSAQSCDDCHAAAGAADWRTDCTFCHGGANDATGAPPVEMDGTTGDPSFATHTAHVQADPDFAALDCVECHPQAGSITGPTHILDGTPGVSEVDFTGGMSPIATWDATTCADSYCHGPSADAAPIADDAGPLGCDDCHATTGGWEQMSSLHLPHLDSRTGITCVECHAAVIDAAGGIVDASKHVNGLRDVAMSDPAIMTKDGGVTCDGACHGIPHDGTGWGHEAGYDEPEVHGVESLTGVLECQTCHGSDLQGGPSGVGCDDCHTSNWREDCTYCHGGQDGDTEGLPPADLDGTTDESAITFRAHPEHADADDHRAVACEECHGTAAATYTDALTDLDHWFDSTPGVAEVSFTGLAAGATYKSGTCSDVSCHGNGLTDGTESDSASGLGCDECHAIAPTGTREHRDHHHDDASCDWCHDSVAASSSAIDGPTLHVDGISQVVFSSTANQWGGMTFNATTGRCSGRCHVAGESKDHENKSWR